MYFGRYECKQLLSSRLFSKSWPPRSVHRIIAFWGWGMNYLLSRPRNPSRDRLHLSVQLHICKAFFFFLDEHTRRNLLPYHSFAFSGEEPPAPHLCYLKELQVPIHSLLIPDSTPCSQASLQGTWYAQYFALHELLDSLSHNAPF